MKKDNGRLLVDIGAERKNTFKSKLYAKGLTIKEFFVKKIDKFIKESEEK